MRQLLSPRLMVLLSLLFALSCKKSGHTWCVKMISPTGNQVNPINTIFSWSKCNPKDTVCFYLFAYSNNTYPTLISQMCTIGTQYIYPYPLDMGKRYAWVLSQKNNQSADTTYFTTALTDTLAVGNYNVTVTKSYPCVVDQTYTTCSTSLGNTIITVTEIGPGKLLFTDNNLMHTSFVVNYGGTSFSTNYPYQNIFGYTTNYGSAPRNLLQVTTPNQISVTQDSIINNQSDFTLTWAGTKIP